MRATLQLAFGGDLITVEEDIKSLQDLFKFYAVFSVLPKTGPNGEEDLYLCYRKVQGKYEYYSVVSEKAGQEFKFGITMESHELFPKGWEPIQRGRFVEGVEQEGEDRPAATLSPEPKATGKPKTEAEQLGSELSAVLWQTLIVKSTKDCAGDFLLALLGAPKAHASVESLKRGIASARAALRQPALLEWASAKWRYEVDAKSSLATKMQCLGLMVRYLGEVSDFQDLMGVLGGDPSKKSSDGVKTMYSNLQSWFTAEPGVPTDKDIGF